MYSRSQNKVPVRIRRTLIVLSMIHSIIREGTLEPCNLHLVLSTCKDYVSLSWIQCTKDPSDRAIVSTLFCGVCQQYESKIASMRNYSATSVRGSQNHKTITYWTTPKVNSILLQLPGATKASIHIYAPIVHCLMTMDTCQLAGDD